jgi:hypothetical protein
VRVGGPAAHLLQVEHAARDQVGAVGGGVAQFRNRWP